jgi:hypothetical protein
MEGIDEFDVLDVWHSISSIIEIFHIVLEAFIMLLLDNLEGLNCGQTLVRALEVPDEHGT